MLNPLGQAPSESTCWQIAQVGGVTQMINSKACPPISKTGPAGTGKTESVKALGHQLGRFVLVFNCDETFDFQVSCLIKTM